MARRVQYSCHGDSSVLQLVTDQPVPARKAGQVLIDNHATSTNPVDYKLREGLGWLADPRLPAVPGGDVAGVVLEADASSAFKPGDRVFGLTHRCVGAYTSRIVLPEAALARIPERKSFEDAAAFPLAALTAWQALDLARVQPGQRVLVHAGAGGVGTFTVQLAKARGLWVAATCSARNADFVKGLGADEVVDYTAQDFAEVYKERPFDAVLDAIVRDGYEKRSLSVLKRSGTYVHHMPSLSLGQIAKGFFKGALGLGPRYRVVLVSPNGAQLTEIGKLWEEGKVKPVIAEVLPLDKAAEAQDRTKQGHNRGKIVLKIAE
ncbi:hypothetical protein COHA_001380 [Chlorella ohadii]|uniref:Enoyl reductase (ER) domain-containing protein n=1 Tax=Chlorella ohadii TaxID=2649997 RepID=A0AAD5H5I0_9CHLO|nr:hypothetical protein COHA_001380 [Chlorella ohadii]